MNTMVQSARMVKPKSDKVRDAAQTVREVLTEHPFLNWKWVLADVLIIGVWLVH